MMKNLKIILCLLDMEIAPVQWWETVINYSNIISWINGISVTNSPWTSEKIFSILLCVANVTFSFSDISPNFSPIIAKSNTLYIRRWSQRPNWRFRLEKMAFSVTFPSVKIYSRHGEDEKVSEDLGTREEVDCSLLKCCPQSEVWRSLSVRNTLEIVSAKTLNIEKFRRRHGGDYEKYKRQ